MARFHPLIVSMSFWAEYHTSIQLFATYSVHNVLLFIMRNMKSIIKTIFHSIKIAQKDFSINPYDWTGSEANARSKFYLILLNNVPGNIYISNNNPIPKFIKQPSNRVHLEYKITKGLRPDIIIYKNGEGFLENNDFNIINKIDAFIEIKTAWGYSSKQFTGAGVLKDLQNLSEYNGKEIFIYFIANEFYKMTDDHIETYHRELKKYITFKERIFIVFRDCINPEELFW